MRELINAPNIEAATVDFPNGRVRDRSGSTPGTTYSEILHGAAWVCTRFVGPPFFALNSTNCPVQFHSPRDPCASRAQLRYDRVRRETTSKHTRSR